VNTTAVTAPERHRLRPVPGPSAFGGGRRRFFNLLWLNSKTEFKLGFHGTIFGYVWSLARPLLLFLVYYEVFTKVFRIAVADYAALLLFNIMLFSLFQEGTNNAVTSVVAREGLVRKTQFPRIVIPLSVVLTALFNTSLNFIAVLVFLFILGITPMWTWLLIPVLVLALLVLTIASAMLLSSLYPRFRDVAIIWSVMATAIFYATPALYPIEYVPGGLRVLVQLNPLTPIFEQARKWVIDPSAPGAVQASEGSEYLLVLSGVIAVVLCVAAFWSFEREAKRIAEEL
jgi:ABC-2 type transport system permease protein